MMRIGFVGAAIGAALVGAVGCKSNPSAPSPGSGTGSAVAPSDAGADPRLRPPVPWHPTEALVRGAFGGHMPEFPLLARDGSAVAMGIESPVGRSEVATYSVAIFTDWTGSSDAWGPSAQAYPIVDSTMAAMLLDAVMGEDAPAPDPETLKTRAAPVTKRLTEGEFSPFDRPAAELGPKITAFGPAKLEITHDPEAALIVHLFDETGKELTSHTVRRQVMGHVADVECVSTPVARRAWLDVHRKRILVEIGWNAGPEACRAPDPEYGLWSFP